MENEIKLLLEEITSSYIKWCGSNPTEYQIESIEQFPKDLKVVRGRTYTKILKEGAVWGFIVNEDGPKFRRGDVLKPASWSAPAKNYARGNVFGDIDGFDWPSAAQRVKYI